jgi:hypothetical protein
VLLHVKNISKNVSMKIARKHAKSASMPATRAYVGAKNVVRNVKQRKNLSVQMHAKNAKKRAIVVHERATDVLKTPVSNGVRSSTVRKRTLRNFGAARKNLPVEAFNIFNGLPCFLDITSGAAIYDLKKKHLESLHILS